MRLDEDPFDELPGAGDETGDDTDGGEADKPRRPSPTGRGSNLSQEDRRKGGERSSRQQDRRESGQFAGKRPPAGPRGRPGR